MPVSNNFFLVEDALVEKLTVVTGVQTVYRHAFTDGLNDKTVALPSLFVRYRGFIPEKMGDKRAKLRTRWEVGVCCHRDNYISQGGALVIDCIKAISGKQDQNWFGTAELSAQSSGNNEPEWSGELVYMPLSFDVTLSLLLDA